MSINSSNKVMKCSRDLFSQLHLNSLTGQLTLNHSLDYEHCTRYSYIIKATDILERRLNSLLNLQIHVGDVNDNGPRFEHNRYLFQVAENAIENGTNMRMAITDSDSISTPTLLRLRMENMIEDQTVDLNETFALRIVERRFDNETTSIYLVTRKQLDFEQKRRYFFRLIVTDDRGQFDSTLVEIIVLDVNEFAPEIRSISSCSSHVRTATLSIQKLEYLIESNTDVLSRTMDDDDTSVSLVKIDAIDQDDSDYSSPSSSSDNLSMRIEEVRAMTSRSVIGDRSSPTSAEEDSDVGSPLIEELGDDASLLFTVDLDKRLAVYLDEVKKFALARAVSNQKPGNELVKSEVDIPILIAFVTVVVEDRGEMSTRLNFVVVLVNNRTSADELRRLDAYMVRRFADNWSSLRYSFHSISF
jgi:hypothetical protein